MNGERIRTHVTFKTDRFNQTEVGAHFINDCCFGEDCAAWLVTALRERGWAEIEEPWQEDWGWQTGGERHARRYLVSVGLVPEDDPLWLVHVEESPRLIARLMGRVGPSVLRELVEAIHAVLRPVPTCATSAGTSRTCSTGERAPARPRRSRRRRRTSRLRVDYFRGSRVQPETTARAAGQEDHVTRARWLGTMLAATVCGCSTGYNRGAIDAALLEAKPTYTSTDLSVEEIERLKAQLVLPARIAVAPPLAAPRWRGPAQDTWTREEVAVIDSWLEPLRAAGIASELIVLPSSLVSECGVNAERGCRQRAQRAAAARLHADALLVLNLATSTDEYVNPASLLYLTIAGMWVVPATHRDALTVTEGVLLDNRNEYLYAFARGEGERRAVRPVMYTETEAVVQASRVAALESFGRAFVAQARQLRPGR